MTTSNAAEHRGATTRQKVGALATVTVVGGTILVDGAPVGAASFTVTNTDASGAGSLAQAVEDANANGAELDTITFAPGVSGTITVASRLVINDDLEIVGPGSDQITLTSAGGDVLYLYNGASLSVSGLTFANDNGDGVEAGGAGDIEFIDVTFDGGPRPFFLGTVGDVTLTGVDMIDQTSRSVIEFAGAVSVFDSTFALADVEGYGYVDRRLVDVLNADSVALDGVGGALNDRNTRPYLAIYDAGDGTATGPVVTIGDVDGDIGLQFRSADGDLEMVDATILANSRVRGSFSGDKTLQNLELVESTVRLYASGATGGALAIDDISLTDTYIRVGDATSATVQGVELTSTQQYVSTGLRLTHVGVSGGGVPLGSSPANAVGDGPVVARVTDVSGEGTVNLYRVTGETSISDITLGGESYSGLRARNLFGDVSISDVSITSSYSTLAIDGRNFTFYGDPDQTIEGFEVDVRDVEVGRPDGAGRIDISDFAEGDDSGGMVMGAAQLGPDVESNVTLQDITIFGSLSIEDSVVTGDDILVGPTDALDRRRRLSLGEGAPVVEPEPTTVAGDDLVREGPTPLYLRGSSASFTNLTVAEHEASSAIELHAAHLDLAHSTFADNDLSVATVVATDDSSLELDHVVLADTADGIFLDERERADDPRIRLAAPSAAGDPFEMEAEYSLLPTSTVGALELAESNLEVDDPRMGPLQDNGGPQPTVLPLGDSPARNGGDPAIADAPPTDQRGFERIVGVIDIGATESTPLIQSIEPARFVDTRAGEETIDDQYEGEGKRASGSTYEVQIAGRGDVPSDAVAVVMNITSVAPDEAGFVTAYPCDADKPNASSLNFTPGTNAGNEIVAGLSADGKICLFTQGSTHLVVDVTGYADAQAPIRPVVPARAFESRIGQTTADGRFQATGRLAVGTTQTVMMAGRNGVPSDAGAVVVNVTAIKPDTAGFLTLHACLPVTPLSSSLNFAAGEIRGNEVVVDLDDLGNLCVFASTGTDVAIDVVGYLPDGAIESLTPARLLETRDGQPTADATNEGGGPVAAGSTTTLPVAGRSGVPADAKAVVVNVTAINPSAAGFVTVSPCVTPTPTASSLNYEAGSSTGNEIIAALDDAGAMCLFSSASTHLAVDAVAFIR